MCKIIAGQGKLLCQPTARSKHRPGQGHHRTPAGKRVFSRDCWQKAAGLVPLALSGHGAAPAFPLQHHLFFSRESGLLFTRGMLISKSFGWETLHPRVANRGKIHEQLQEAPGEAVTTKICESHPCTPATVPWAAEGCSARKTPPDFPCRLQTRRLGASAASLPQLHL